MTVAPEAEARGTRPRWTTLAVVGLLLAAAGPLLMFVAGALWGLDVGDSGVILGIPFAAGVIAAGLVWRFGTWAKVVGLVIAFGLLGLMSFTASAVFAPQSFFDFIPAVLGIGGGLLALVSCIGAIVAARRGHVSARPEGAERTWIRGALAVIPVLAILSGILTVTGRSTVDASGAAARSHMKDFEFAPKSYSVTGGSQIFVDNDDPFRHTFTVDALGIDVDFTVGTSKLVAIPSRPGTYVLYCKYHTSNPDKPTKDDMAATLVIT